MVGGRHNPCRLQRTETTRVLRPFPELGGRARRPSCRGADGATPGRQDGAAASRHPASPRWGRIQARRPWLPVARPAAVHAALDRGGCRRNSPGERQPRRPPGAVSGRDPVPGRLGAPPEGVRGRAPERQVRRIGLGSGCTAAQEHRIGSRPLYGFPAAAADVPRVP